MGADFLLASCKMPTNLVGTVLFPEDSEAGRAELIRRVNNDLFADTLRVVGEIIGEDAPESLGDEWDEFTRVVKERIIEAIEVLNGNSREVGIFPLEFGQPSYIFTGGMSWGDSPTEAWDDVVILAASQITAEPIDAPAADATGVQAGTNAFTIRLED